VDDALIDRLRNHIDPAAWTKDLEIPYESRHFWRRARDLVSKDRFGEVVFGVERPNGKIIAVSSPEYPAGVFRIPTGGIFYGEDILDAVKREVREELGLIASVRHFAGVLRIRFTHGGDAVPFYSFLFHLKEESGNLLTDATDDEVSEVMEAGPEDLDRMADNLLHIREEWRDWGRFRHATTHAMAVYLKGRNP
jgi:8-oxo-dGTP pyrophosphatase MutT (NUDIX family)